MQPDRCHRASRAPDVANYRLNIVAVLKGYHSGIAAIGFEDGKAGVFELVNQEHSDDCFVFDNENVFACHPQRTRLDYSNLSVTLVPACGSETFSTWTRASPAKDRISRVPRPGFTSAAL